MRITDLEITVVSVPFSEPEVLPWDRRHGLTNAILRVTTDAGVVGLGEAPGCQSIRLMRDALDATRSRVIGEDPRRIQHIAATVLSSRGFRECGHVGRIAVAGLEMALWDIVGKSAGLPVSALFGGVVRGRVAYCRHVHAMTPAEAAAAALAAVDEGIETLHMIVGSDLRGDLERVAAVRTAAGPALRLRVEPAEPWPPYAAVHAIRELEKFDLEWVEQPVSISDIAGLAYVRSAVAAPVAANLGASLHPNLVDLVRRRAADVVVTSPHHLHGLLSLKMAAAFLESAGVSITKQSFGELGIATMAGIQVLATCQNATPASQPPAPSLQGDVIVGGPPTIRAGAIEVPAGRGLGVELDDASLARYHEHYRRAGEYVVDEDMHASRPTVWSQ